MDDLISIIIPVYNVENYIEKCLDSIIDQTYRNLQIILIDDGSSDGSGLICDAYAKKDKRIQVVHQKNSGVSKARNKGLSLVQGKYVGFCDADDWIEHDMYEYLYDLLKQTKYSVAVCGAWLETVEGNTPVGYATRDTLYLDVSDALAALHVGTETNAWLCTKLFVTDHIKNITFDENLKVAEDYIFECDALVKSNGMICGKEIKYHYIQRKNSVCNNGYTIEYEKGVTAVKKTIDHLVEMFPDKEKELQSKYILEMMGILTAMIKGNNINNTRVAEIQKIIRKYVINYIFTKGVKMQLKGSAVVICFSFSLFEFVYRKNKKFS